MILRKAHTLAIVGCTNSGKTTIARRLIQMIEKLGMSTALIEQDDFFLTADKVERVQRSQSPEEFYYHYDCVAALDVPKIAKALKEANEQKDFVIIEGNMITEIEELMELIGKIIFLTIDQKTCRRRRDQRNYDPPDIDGYFEEIVWPAYQEHVKNAMMRARTDDRFAFLDVSSDRDTIKEADVFEVIRTITNDCIQVTTKELDINKVIELLQSPACGATSIFLGTTRDVFNDQKVEKLQYESYDEMVYPMMRRLCSDVRKSFPAIHRLIIWHRVGDVGITEASVIIAASSSHRRDAIEAVTMAINELKASVPIWKKEVYVDGEHSWKENEEWRKEKTKGIQAPSSTTTIDTETKQIDLIRQLIGQIGDCKSNK